MLLNADAKPQQSRSTALSSLLLLPVLLGLAFFVRMPLVWTDQAIFSALTVACCIVVGRLSGSRLITSVLMMVSIFCTLRYIVWRWVSSVSYLNNVGWNVDRVSLVFAMLLLCAESYAVVILLLGYFQSARPLKRRPEPLPADTDLWPSVDVYIPTYNEPLEVVRPTVLAAMGIDWPQDRIHVYILDDGRRSQFQEFAAECGAGYLTRFDNAHAKAGNINSALKNTTSEYIAIFDCDHIATRSFLQVTMGWFFKDKRLAMVQTPHHFYSPDPFERNLNVFRKIPNEGALFYGVVQDGNDLWDATFFCGSCAVIKREALEQVGGIAVETVTEDAHTALRLQRLGWNTAYIGIPQAAGLATGSLAAHVGQRIRWARGMVQILRTENPLFARGLRFAQRLCYFNCVVHYLYAIPRLIFISSPLVYLLLGRSNVYGMMWEIVAYAAPHLVLSNMVNSRSQGDHRHSMWNEVYEMVLAPYILLPTTFALINPKWGKFNVTAKSSVVEESYFDWKIARPYLFLLSLNLLALIISVPRYFMGGDSSGVLAVNIVWALFNTLMLGVTVAVSFENRQRRSSVRVEADLTATLAFDSDEVHHCRVIDLSEGGLAMRSDRILGASAGQRGNVSIRAGNQEFRFEVETVRTSENRIHMRFPQTDLKHQRAITQIVYARADSWLDWNKDQRRDRILSSLVSVLGIGAAGIWKLPSLLIKQEKSTQAGRAKSAVAKATLPGIALCLLLPFGHSDARQLPVPELSGKAAAQTAPKGELSFEDSQSFSDLGHKGAITLRSDNAKASFSFVEAATKIVNAAQVAVRYQTGNLNPGDGYVLAITLNDVEVTTFPLNVAGGSADVARLSLPADVLVHDNTLVFELRRDCEGPCPHTSGSAAWVRIEPASTLETSGLVLPLPNRLSMLPSPFFDSSVRHSIDLPVVFESQPDLPSLNAAGVLASWYGSMAAYRGSHFTVSIGHIPAGNAILLANSNGPLAASLGLSGMAAQVAICDNPSDHYGKLLAIIASSSADLLRLARMVAQNQFHEEIDRVSVGIDRLSEPAAALPAPSWLDTTRPLRITKDLNDHLLHSKIGSGTSLYFRIAPDLDYGTKITVPLQLAFRLSGMGPDDHVWISIQLNNTFVARRRLSHEDSAESKIESFAIPVSLLYPSNTLTIELATNRSDVVVSDPSSVDLQVLPATSLDLQNPAHFVRMPRLDLFAASGYPFTAKVDLSETSVILPPNATAAQIGVYLDAMGFLAAQTGIPAMGFEVANKASAGDNDRNLLIVASSNNEDVFRRFEQSMVVIPTGGKFELGESSLPWHEWLSRAWFGRKEEKMKLANLLDREGGPRFLLEQFVNPYGRNRSVLVLATRSELDDQPYFDRLAEASRDGAITGGLALADDSRFTSFQLNSGSYALGNGASLPGIYGWLRFHLWILPLFVLAAAFVLARWWELLLARQADMRLNGNA